VIPYWLAEALVAVPWAAALTAEPPLEVSVEFPDGRVLTTWGWVLAADRQGWTYYLPLYAPIVAPVPVLRTESWALAPGGRWVESVPHKKLRERWLRQGDLEVSPAGRAVLSAPALSWRPIEGLIEVDGETYRVVREDSPEPTPVPPPRYDPEATKERLARALEAWAESWGSVLEELSGPPLRASFRGLKLWLGPDFLCLEDEEGRARCWPARFADPYWPDPDHLLPLLERLLAQGKSS